MSIPLIYQDDVLETISVKRTQRIYHPYGKDISYSCHLSKNLWNQAHYLVYPEYKEFDHVMSYEDLDAILNKRSYYKDKDGKYNSDFDNYHKLGATAQQILKVYIKSWISYLKGIKDYWKSKKNVKEFNQLKLISSNDKDYTGIPREPKYKKKDGEFELIFNNQQIKFRETKSGNVWMYFPKNKGNGLKDKDGKPLKILLGNVNNIDSYLINRLIWGKFDEVRIIPKGTGYWIEIVYDEEIIKDKEVLIEKYKLNKDIIMTIDLGVENLVAITDNIGSQPIIIKSEILKAENQWYNKRRSELGSIYDRQRIGCFLKRDKNDNIRYLVNKNGKKIKILTENRNNFVMDSEHKVSRFIIERALDIRSGRIVFTRNPLWKQKIKIGKRNNQNFVQIPHKKLIDKTRYKGEEVGIDVLDLTEEYTSKCSFLDSESLEHHDVYMGKRIYRGLFRTSKGIDISAYIGSKKKKIIDIINADVQGAYNLLRKVDPRFSINTIMEGVAVHGLVPKRLSVSDLMSKSYEDLS